MGLVGCVWDVRTNVRCTCWFRAQCVPHIKSRAPDAYYSISVLGLSSVLMRYMNHNFGHPSLAFDASGRVFPAGPPGRACRGASIT